VPAVYSAAHAVAGVVAGDLLREDFTHGVDEALTISLLGGNDEVSESRKKDHWEQRLDYLLRDRTFFSTGFRSIAKLRQNRTN
jgi:hypothetical protein